mmetsp:Transcript_1550/g.6077  ORF Transcript_1550/g.6077 Transcript_1550/m.6077 type:complete len:255 (-) Transcript_1550:314-1078(-)
MASIGAVFLGPHDGLVCSGGAGKGEAIVPAPSIEVRVPGGGGPGGSGGGSPGGSGGGSPSLSLSLSPTFPGAFSAAAGFADTALLQLPAGASSTIDGPPPLLPPPPRPTRPSRLRLPWWCWCWCWWCCWCAAPGFLEASSELSSDPSLTRLCLLCLAGLRCPYCSSAGAPGGGGGGWPGLTPPPPGAPQLPLLAWPPRPPPPSRLLRLLKAAAPPAPLRPPPPPLLLYPPNLCCCNARGSPPIASNARICTMAR